MSIIRVVIFGFAGLFFSCNTGNRQTNISPAASASAEFSRSGDATSDYYTDAKAWEKWLGLPGLGKGFEGFAFRIWYSPEISRRKKLLEIRESGQGWNATVYSFDIRAMKADSSRAVHPKSGWGEFGLKLMALDPQMLPEFARNADDPLLDDGMTYISEAATKNSYRFAWFSNPFEMKVGNVNARRWQRVLALVKEEFEVSY